MFRYDDFSQEVAACLEFSESGVGHMIIMPVNDKLLKIILNNIFDAPYQIGVNLCFVILSGLFLTGLRSKASHKGGLPE